MVWRLVTFNFGRSALKTREPVSEKLWKAFIVSAPLMLMAELVIYLVAVPLGVLCAVKRGRLADRVDLAGAVSCSTRFRPSWRECCFCSICAMAII